jgi:hypothetical protein
VKLTSIRMGNSQQAWDVPVPRGWLGYDVETDQRIPPKQWLTFDELRFRPRGEPVDGGYSLRVKTINTRVTPADMSRLKIAQLRDIDEVDYLAKRDDLIEFTFRDGTNHLRYNYFRWFSALGDPEATLEMSVAGRAQDVAGLDALFTAFANALRPAT